MQLGLVYLGLLLLIGACYLYMRYSMKQMNTKIIGILELTNTLAQEMEEINKVSNFLGKTRNDDKNVINETINFDSNMNYESQRLQIISDDEDDDDEDDDHDDVGTEVKELVKEDAIEDEQETKMSEMKPSVVEENLDSLIIEGMIDDKTDIDKMTVSALKLKIKERDPNIKLTNLKRNELLNILKNE